MARKKSSDGTPKPKRDFSDIFKRYKKYDTSGGYGSVGEWRSAWESMTGDEARSVVAGSKQTPFALLGLAAPPQSLAELRDAYRARMKSVHPDVGGTDDDARLVIAAYKTLLESLDPKHRRK